MVTNPRTCLVNFRLTTEEHAQVKLAAKAAGARDQIAKLEEQIKVKAGRSVFLTNVLKRLKDLRAEKQKSNSPRRRQCERCNVPAGRTCSWRWPNALE